MYSMAILKRPLNPVDSKIDEPYINVSLELQNDGVSKWPSGVELVCL